MAGTPKKKRRTPAKKLRDQKLKFLKAFEELGTISAACLDAKIPRRTVYNWRQEDEAFAVAWSEIELATTEEMEREAYRRGVKGVEEPVFNRGLIVGSVQKFSDTLLIFMLKSRRPDVYRENVKVEHGGTVKHDHSVDLSKLSPEDLHDLERITAAASVS